MKKIVLSSVFALAALFSFNSIHAQKINPGHEDEVVITGGYQTVGGNTFFVLCCQNALITGISSKLTTVDAQLIITATANSECFNGGQSVKSIPGQTITVSSGKVQLAVTNGNVLVQNLCAQITGGCKSKGGSGWTSQVSNVLINRVVLSLSGKDVDLTSFFHN
ncbi:hypothetical protein [Flavisolibacter tropicus]|uniref:Auto-transporter adhesin head GIN domain-containing protein n=1 Tax=Flavisolibacter tropicus TaxID=1492898 RepID=A0A172TR61_9BACT|nr:hypothetical protein [Flavisolibacter tropicus]ANE49488.1 hypothetical protein SY85_02210 [Flavisolibacter tropicus]